MHTFHTFQHTPCGRQSYRLCAEDVMWYVQCIWANTMRPYVLRMVAISDNSTANICSFLYNWFEWYYLWWQAKVSSQQWVKKCNDKPSLLHWEHATLCTFYTLLTVDDVNFPSNYHHRNGCAFANKCALSAYVNQIRITHTMARPSGKRYNNKKSLVAQCNCEMFYCNTTALSLTPNYVWLLL